MSDYPKRILHADDDPMIRDIVKRALSGNENLKYHTCEDGQQLLEKAQEFKPDLILLDLSMPGCDGVSVMDMLSKDPELVACKIILFTGHQDVAMCDEYRKLGVIGVLNKPVSPGVLPERIRYMWAEAHGKEGIPGGGSSGLM